MPAHKLFIVQLSTHSFTKIKGITMLRLSILISILLISACSQTKVVEYGVIEPELRLVQEDLLNLTQEQLEEKYLNKKVTLLKVDNSDCQLQAGSSNQCIRGYGLSDTRLGKEYPIEIEISLYMNFEKRSHQHFVNVSEVKQTMPTDEQLAQLIHVDEQVSQQVCAHPIYAPFGNVSPHNPDKPWLGCELTYPTQFTGVVFEITLVSNKKHKYRDPTVYIQIIPSGFRYQYEKPWF